MARGTLLVTGAAGFIGARFVESCGTRGIPVVAVDRRASFTERPEHRGLDFGTIVDFEELDAWLATQPRGSDAQPNRRRWNHKCSLWLSLSTVKLAGCRTTDNV